MNVTRLASAVLLALFSGLPSTKAERTIKAVFTDIHFGKTPPFAGRPRASKDGTPRSPWD
jgi:hypothetical protein